MSELLPTTDDQPNIRERPASDGSADPIDAVGGHKLTSKNQETHSGSLNQNETEVGGEAASAQEDLASSSEGQEVESALVVWEKEHSEELAEIEKELSTTVARALGEVSVRDEKGKLVDDLTARFARTKEEPSRTKDSKTRRGKVKEGKEYLARPMKLTRAQAHARRNAAYHSIQPRKSRKEMQEEIDQEVSDARYQYEKTTSRKRELTERREALLAERKALQDKTGNSDTNDSLESEATKQSKMAEHKQRVLDFIRSADPSSAKITELLIDKGFITASAMQQLASKGRQQASLADIAPIISQLESSGLMVRSDRAGSWQATINPEIYNALVKEALSSQEVPVAKDADSEETSKSEDAPRPSAEVIEHKSETDEVEKVAEQNVSHAFENTARTADAQLVVDTETSEVFDEEHLEKTRSRLNLAVEKSLAFLRQERGGKLSAAETAATIAEEQDNVFEEMIAEEYAINTVDPTLKPALKEATSLLKEEFKNYLMRRAINLYEDAEKIIRDTVNGDSSDATISKKYQSVRKQVWAVVEQGSPVAEREMTMKVFKQLKTEDAQRRQAARERKVAKPKEQSTGRDAYEELLKSVPNA